MRVWLPLAAFVALGSAAPPAAAFELQRTKGGHDVRWSADDVVLAVDPSLVAATYAAADAARDAAAAWSTQDGAPRLHVVADPGGNTIGALGKNVAFFVPGGYAPAHGALAITVVTFDQGTGHILDADIVVNGAYRFAVLDASARSDDARQIANDATEATTPAAAALSEHDAFDLAHVLTHETGHLLGLSDSAAPDAVMFRMTAPNDASRRTPGADDLGGVRALYAPTDARTGQGCAGASVSRVPPDDATSRVALLLAVAGALFLAARKRPAVRAVIVGALAVLLVARAPSPARGDSGARRSTGHARARVTGASLRSVGADGPLRTTRLALAVEECRIARCPRTAAAVVWGGTRDGTTQLVGHTAPPPAPGDAVEIDWHDADDDPLRPALGPAFFGAR